MLKIKNVPFRIRNVRNLLFIQIILFFISDIGAQNMGVLDVDSICANISYTSNLPTDFPGENFTYNWSPTLLIENPAAANATFNFPYGYDMLTYFRIRTGNSGTFIDTLQIVFTDLYAFDVPFQYYYCPNGINTIVLNEVQGVLVNPPVFISPVDGVSNTFNINITSPNVTQFSFQLINNFGCPTFPYTMFITKADSLAISIPDVPSVFCLSSSPVPLAPGIPNTGVYSINGNSVSQINPQLLGEGSFILNYSIEQNQCVYFALDTFSVIDVEDVDFIEGPALCPNDSAITFSNYISPFTGQVSYNGVNVSVFDPSLYNPGQVVFTYSTTLTGECSYSQDFTTFVKPPPPKPNIVTFTGFNEFCFGDSLLVGVNPYPNILWNTGDTVPSFTVNATQNLIATYTSSLGCSSSDTLIVTELEPIVLNLSSPTYPNGFEISTFGANDGIIVANASGGFPPYSFVDANLGLFTSPLENLTANNYVIRVNDARGCQSTDTITLREPEKEVIDPVNPFGIPNSFTPNGDGYNDFWVFKNIFLAPSNRLSVFNRWGNLVFSANNYQNNWNGSVKEGVSETTYFYVFEDLTNNKSYKGYVQVVVRN